MRNFAKVCPQFWFGKTGKKIRDAGPTAQLVALYLITCPSSHMSGIFYLPLETLCHEIGLARQGALKALRRLFQCGFASYDRESEEVFVYGMAAYQISETLDPRDKRHKGLISDLEKVRNAKFLREFYERYCIPFNLPDHLGNRRPLQGASKSLRSQEKEKDQETEQEKKNEQKQEGGVGGTKIVLSNGSRETRLKPIRINEALDEAKSEFYRNIARHRE